MTSQTTPQQKLEALGFTLSTPPAPAANYVSVSQLGDSLFVSGQISAGADGMIGGQLGKELDIASGQKAAAICAVNVLSQLTTYTGAPLDKIRIVKLTVLVASTPDFTDQHLVANGASDLLGEVLGENGKHARAAFGVTSLPLGAAVEVEAIAEIVGG